MSHDIRPKPCDKCSDWHSNIKDVEHYPINPGESPTNDEDLPVRLNFTLQKNGLATLGDWIRGNPQKATQSKCKKYLDFLCLLGTHAEDMAKQMKHGLQNDPNFDITECDLYPQLL